MAASGQGGISKQVINLNNSVTMRCPSATQVDAPLPNGDGFLTDSIGCDIQEENDAFVRVFTSQNVSSDYHSIDQYTVQRDINGTLISSQISNFDDVGDNDSAINQPSIEILDAHLHNLPKEMYIGKLLERCSNDENIICWYRNVLCSRARSQNDCPNGNLISRKTTKSGSSAQKYARDCYTLHMFIQGDGTGIEHVFDKQKGCGTDMSKIPMIELRVVVQSLLQRVTDLEKSLTEKENTIQSMDSKIKLLESEHNNLQSDYDTLEAEARGRFTKYDSSQKLNADRIKRIESDLENVHGSQEKTQCEIKKLAKISGNNSRPKSPAKSYASVLGSTACDTPTQNSSVDHDAAEKKSPNALSKNIGHNLKSIRKELDKSDTDLDTRYIKSPPCAPTDKTQVNSTRSSNDIQIERSPDRGIKSFTKTQQFPSGASGEKTQVNSSRSADSIQSERTHDRDTRSKDNPKELCRSVKYKGDSCVITVDEKSSNQPEKDIFLGVSYRKTARYYLSGIDKLSTSLGIQNYIQSKGIKITHFVLFKPKPRSRLLSAKLNVPLQHAESIEHHDFWPNGVRCRKWFSERQWEEKCATPLAQESWEHDINAS